MARPRSDQLQARPGRADRRLLLALLLRLDRTTQGRRSMLQRDMAVTSELYGVRTLGRHARADVSVTRPPSCSSPTGWATACPFRCGPAARQILDDRRPTPGHHLRDDREASGQRSTTACRRSTRGSWWRSRARPSATFRPACAPASRPARRCRRRSSGVGRRRPAPSILDGIGSTEALHIFIANQPRLIASPRYQSGRPVPGYDCAHPRRDTAMPVPRGDERPPVDPRRFGGEVLLEQAGEDRRDHGRTAGSTPATPTARTPTAISSTTAAATTC